MYKLHKFLVTAVLLAVFLAASASAQTGELVPGSAVYWSNGENPDGKPTSIIMVSREILPRQFFKEVSGRAGRSIASWHVSDDADVAGPAPLARQVAKHPGVDFVEIVQHKMTVGYRDGYLTEKRMSTELAYLQGVLKTVTGKTLVFTKVDNLDFHTFIPDDCKVWAGTPYSCQGNGLHVPPGVPFDRKRFEDIPGIVHVTEALRHNTNPSHIGWRSIGKSPLYSWAEVRQEMKKAGLLP